MNRRIMVIVFVLMLGLLLPTAVSRTFILAQSQPLETGDVRTFATVADAVPEGLGIRTAWNKRDSTINYYNPAILGPNTCTAFGDPFSPLDSPWEPGPYTYQFRIRIPADYPYNEVRVELFDPDSINAPNMGSFIIPRTNAAILQGLAPTTTGSCGASQMIPCLIDTGELALYNDDILSLEQINPYFIWRVDQNLGAGTPPGNGLCGSPGNYDPNYNTSTLFELYYFQSSGEIITRTTLATYTGQTGDGLRDNGDHQTDRYWVSPGAPPSFDQIANVPVDAGSPATFQVDLTTDVPNMMTDPQTGDRYVYLGVTTLSGASENGFDIWAGPPNYINNVPSEVNARNLHVLNTPGSHYSRGAEVTAVKYLPLNSNVNFAVDVPLIYVGPEMAGQEFFVSLFDTDSGTQPPITFFFDRIAQSDWSLTFAQSGVPDPDGQTRNCVPGDCNNVWVDPPYKITVPGNTEDCDYSDLTNDINCVPFYGGWLTANFIGGSSDTYVWEVTGPTSPPPSFDPTEGCSAFPIAIHEGARSVTPPGTGANPYPNPGDFDGPGPHPTYEQFYDHRPDEPLLDAKDGYVFKLNNGVGDNNFGWLVWNEYVNASNQTLAGSLAWPGNSQDYATIAPGLTPPGFTHPVYGYLEPGDPSDTEMHIDDWVKASTGAVGSNQVRNLLEGHIVYGRTLRLPLWDEVAGSGTDLRYKISGFALFKLVGYHLSQSQGVSWLLLEFVGHDDSCGQTAPVTAVTVTGPSSGTINTAYTFTAAVDPFYATTPITYVWGIDGQSPVTQTNGLTDTVTVSWADAGTYTITATAVNDFSSPITATHQMTITGNPPGVPPTAVSITGPLSGSLNMTYTFTATISPTHTTQPITYVWEVAGQAPLMHTGGITDALLMSWAAAGSYDLMVTAVNESGGPVSDTHTILIGLDERRLYLPTIFNGD